MIKPAPWRKKLTKKVLIRLYDKMSKNVIQVTQSISPQDLNKLFKKFGIKAKQTGYRFRNYKRL